MKKSVQVALITTAGLVIVAIIGAYSKNNGSGRGTRSRIENQRPPKLETRALEPYAPFMDIEKGTPTWNTPLKTKPVSEIMKIPPYNGKTQFGEILGNSDSKGTILGKAQLPASGQIKIQFFAFHDLQPNPIEIWYEPIFIDAKDSEINFEMPKSFKPPKISQGGTPVDSPWFEVPKEAASVAVFLKEQPGAGGFFYDFVTVLWRPTE